MEIIFLLPKVNAKYKTVKEKYLYFRFGNIKVKLWFKEKGGGGKRDSVVVCLFFGFKKITFLRLITCCYCPKQYIRDILHLFSETLRDKTMEDKFVHNSTNDKQNNQFRRY